MRDDLIKEKKPLEFYKNMVSISQKDLHSSEKFLEQAFVAMLMGHEFGESRLHQRCVYEILLMCNLSSNCFGKEKDVGITIDNIIYPFAKIDKDEYYRKILTDNPLLLRELFFVCRFVDDLEHSENNSTAITLLNLRNPKFYEVFKSFSRLKEINRTGWVRRNVKKDYQENDANHTMQMIGLASAYFTLYEPSDLDFNKVMEMIIIHEIGELLAGDIPEGDLLHESKHDIEARGVRNTFEGVQSGEYFVNLWEEFESRETEEAKFVYELDKFDPIVKADYLDEELDRTDLLPDFYGYEEKRGTFENGRLKKVFKYLGDKVNR